MLTTEEQKEYRWIKGRKKFQKKERGLNDICRGYSLVRGCYQGDEEREETFARREIQKERRIWGGRKEG